MSAAATRAVRQVVSANDLVGGQVIYRSADGWTERLDDAAVAQDAAAAAALLAAAQAEPERAVGPYLVDVDGGAPPKPIALRERLRDRGPSVRPDLGRQAEIAS